jgi:hypothetical protein
MTITLTVGDLACDNLFDLTRAFLNNAQRNASGADTWNAGELWQEVDGQLFIGPMHAGSYLFGDPISLYDWCRGKEQVIEELVDRYERHIPVAGPVRQHVINRFGTSASKDYTVLVAEELMVVLAHLLSIVVSEPTLEGRLRR